MEKTIHIMGYSPIQSFGWMKHERSFSPRAKSMSHRSFERFASASMPFLHSTECSTLVAVSAECSFRLRE